jgi:glycosyltransferase involved in cell wall biosynthesis
VIASDAGGYRENVKAVANAADGSGWLVEPGNVRALTQAIEEALSLSAQDYQRMGENGRTNVAARFTQAAMVANTLNVYRDILGSGC